MPRVKPHAKAALFRKLHDRSAILVLPNAWDVASARIFEEAGFPAIAKKARRAIERMLEISDPGGYSAPKLLVD